MAQIAHTLKNHITISHWQREPTETKREHSEIAGDGLDSIILAIGKKAGEEEKVVGLQK
jgi:hypothetical protein